MLKGVPFHYRAAMKKTSHLTGKQLRVPLAERIQSSHIRNMAYSKKIELAVFDWAGTTINPYSTAPLAAMVETFAQYGMKVTMDEARGPMGISKIEHIRAISQLPGVQEQWQKKHGRSLDKLDVEAMYNKYLPLQLDCLPSHSDLIEGVAETVSDLQNQGILIGTTTGFTRDMIDRIIPHAKAQGYAPNATVAGDDVNHGCRPAPHMIFRNMDILNIKSIQNVVKVGDTVTDIEEALNAGCWSVGVVAKSSLCAVNGLEHEAQLGKKELKERRAQAAAVLKQAGAHYVINNIEQLLLVIEDINQRLLLGEFPLDDFKETTLNTPFVTDQLLETSLLVPGFKDI